MCFLHQERQNRLVLRWPVGHGFLLRIDLVPSSVLLVLVQIELEIVVKGTVLIHIAPEQTPKVAAGGVLIPKGTSSKVAFLRAASGSCQVDCPSRRL